MLALQLCFLGHCWSTNKRHIVFGRKLICNKKRSENPRITSDLKKAGASIYQKAPKAHQRDYSDNNQENYEHQAKMLDR